MIDGKYNLTLTTISKQMKLSSPKNQIQKTFPITFNDTNITKWPHRKHLGILLDSKLNFNTHIDQEIKKCNKLIGLTRGLSVNLLRNALLKIYKSFNRPHIIN